MSKRKYKRKTSNSDRFDEVNFFLKIFGIVLGIVVIIIVFIAIINIFSLLFYNHYYFK